MKKILMIGTGGTIASEVTEDGLVPELSSQQLLEHIPAISQICQVDSLQLLNLDSTNITPEHWLDMARCLRRHYDAYDGFVITHGTDTMAYTAAGLSYLIQESPKPIVLTGAQKPIGYDTTDSKINLADAFRVAAADMPGVSIVFNGKVILGTRAQKTHSKSFQAFSSINSPFLGVLRDGTLLPFIQQDCAEKPRFYDRLDTRVGLMKLIPGTDHRLLDFQLEHSEALIIESFGVGGLPEAGGFYESVRRALERGKTVLLRPRRAGDRLMLANGSHATVQKLFIDRKLPRALRDALPVFECGGVVLAAAGLGASRDALPAEGQAAWIICVTEKEEIQHAQ